MNLLEKQLPGSVSHPLTAEQQAVVDHNVPPGQMAKVVAYAGTGKTSTFVAYASKRSDIQMTYLAFNKSVEVEARSKFGVNVLPKTVHALAYSRVGKNYPHIVGNVQNWMVAKALHCPIYEATIICKTLETYLNSAEPWPEPKHVEPDHLHRLKPDYQGGIVDATRALWDCLMNTTHGFDITHSGYLKLYQLSKPTIPGDIILLDEAQDTNPVTQALVLDQLNKGKAVLMCGDPYQQIYAWRGAVDSMQQCECETFRLTQSFRFGQAIADKANTILNKFFGETVPLVGLATIPTKAISLAGGEDPDNGPGEYYEAQDEGPEIRTTITRTNSAIFASVAALALAGKPFHVIGREAFYQLLDQLTDVFFLYAGKRDMVMDRRVSRHPTFNDLTEFADSTLDIELRSRCACVENYADQIPTIVQKVREHYHREPTAETPIFVTCHKAKGLEWDHVIVSEDFEDLYDEEGKLKKVGTRESDIAKDEVNLLYVAVTRGKKTVKLNSNLCRLCQNAQSQQP